jgi:outer membrane protein assembly factor BamB
MFEFDKLVSDAVSKDDVTYTRYADDLTFSARRTGYLNAVRPAVDDAVRRIPWPELTINESKTVLATRKYKREVTGLILANDGRVTIGRDKKKLLSATVHHFKLRKLNRLRTEELAGMLAYVNAVEPAFLEKLCSKYGEDVVRAIQRIGRGRARLDED